MKTLSDKEAFGRIASACAAKEHCRAEIQEKLRKWGLDAEIVEGILATLEKEKYIDEERFCQSFVNDKYRFDKWGKVKIAHALQMKKISRVVINSSLNKIDQEEYLQILTKLMQSKKKSIRAKDEFDLNRKLIRFAMSRGYEMKDIRKCIELSEDDDFYLE